MRACRPDAPIAGTNEPEPIPQLLSDRGTNEPGAPFATVSVCGTNEPDGRPVLPLAGLAKTNPRTRQPAGVGDAGTARSAPFLHRC